MKYLGMLIYMMEWREFHPDSRIIKFKKVSAQFLALHTLCNALGSLHHIPIWLDEHKVMI